MINRDDQGDYWWELRPCAYWDDFSKQIVSGANIAGAAVAVIVVVRRLLKRLFAREARDLPADELLPPARDLG